MFPLNDRAARAAAQLAIREHRIADPVLLDRRTETDSGRRQVHQYAIASGRAPNGRHVQVVVDQAGRPVDLDQLNRQEGRKLFGPRRFDIDRRALRELQDLEATTIEPTENHLVLPPGTTFGPEAITVHVPASTRATKLDVYLLADTTGSMGGALTDVQNSSAAILDALRDLDLDVAVGVGSYRDLPGDAFTHQLSPTTDRATIIDAVGSWTAVGGGDLVEGQLYALDRIGRTAEIGWRVNAKRIVVWFGDAPGHEPICPAISGLPDEITLATVRRLLVDLDITVIAISTTTGVSGGLDGDPTSGAGGYRGFCGDPGGRPGQATDLAESTGGVFLADIDPTGVANAIIDTVNRVANRISTVQLDPAGPASAFVQSIDPPVFGPLDGRQPHDLEFRVTFAGLRSCGLEEQSFDGRIAVKIDGNVVGAQKALTVTVPPCLIVRSDPVAVVSLRDLGPAQYPSVSVLVARRPDGEVAHLWRDASGAWTTQLLGTNGELPSPEPPFAITAAEEFRAFFHDPIHALVHSRTGRLLRNHWNGAEWLGWEDLGLPAGGVEVAESPGASQADVLIQSPGDTALAGRLTMPLVYGSNGELYRIRHADWFAEGRPLPTRVVSSAVGSPPHPRRRLVPERRIAGFGFVVGSDRALHVRASTDAAAVNWTWQRLGAPDGVRFSWTRRPSCVWFNRPGGDVIGTFVLDTDRQLWLVTWSGVEGAAVQFFAQRAPATARISGTPSAVDTGAGLLAFVRGADGRLWGNRLNSSLAPIWIDLGAPTDGSSVAGNPSAVFDGTSVQVFCRSSNDNLWAATTTPALASPAWSVL